MHKVTCIYCKKVFDRDKVPFRQISPRRYAHMECALAENNKHSKQEKDKEELEAYILKLFNIDFIDARTRKLINQYTDPNGEYRYTYSGIHKALTYFYEIKKNDISRANGSIGIVPYIYKESYEYYYSIWLAQ